jgi:hypothetical protein
MIANVVAGAVGVVHYGCIDDQVRLVGDLDIADLQGTTSASQAWSSPLCAARVRGSSSKAAQQVGGSH